MSTLDLLLRHLADGKLHSGCDLAVAAGVSRAAVSKQLQALRQQGLEISAQAGQGYQLANAVEWLDEVAICALLGTESQAALDSLKLFWSIDSTSAWLAAQPPVNEGRFSVCLAEHQTGGRGRRGRQWLSPVGAGISLSLKWYFNGPPVNLSALSLAVGLAVLRVVEAAGIPGLGIKWPNDILVDGRKLAGVLIDLNGETEGPVHVVIGVGINALVSGSLVSEVQRDGGLEPAGLASWFRDRPVPRNQLVAGLVDEIWSVLRDYEQQGFDALMAEWKEHDVLMGCPVTVSAGKTRREGIANGVLPDGSLRLRVEGAEEKVAFGEVSLRESR
jgi:BirA family biotin operon repressor/biotin-[acetyl-CoA-carboxylase] ligase